MKPDRNPLAPHQIHLAPVLGLCVSERVERGIRNHPEPGRIKISNYFCLGTYNVGPPDRRRLPSGGIPPHEQVERSGHRWGDGEAVCRTPRRKPARPARASTQWGLPGAARRARVAREGRWGPAPDWETDVRGQDGPKSGSDAVGSDIRAGLSGQLLWLSAGTQPPRGTARTTRAVHDGGHRLDRGCRGQW